MSSMLSAITVLAPGNKPREGNVKGSQYPARFFSCLGMQLALMKNISHSFRVHLFDGLPLGPHNGPGGMGKRCAVNCTCVPQESRVEILSPRWWCSQAGLCGDA